MDLTENGLTIVKEIEVQICHTIGCPDTFHGIIFLQEMLELCHCIRSTHYPHDAVAKSLLNLQKSGRTLIPQGIQNLESVQKGKGKRE